MQVFKFGGASVKDADGIINLIDIIRKNQQQELLIVVSAMGKTTNMLESLTRAYIDRTEEVMPIFDNIRNYHQDIVTQLFAPNHPVFNAVDNTFVEIEWIIEEEPHDDDDFIYDQIVSIGELVSSRIVAACLNLNGLKTHWLDARSYIHTDNVYREGSVDWEKTSMEISRDLPPLLSQGFVVTQGFLGGTSENYTTTLGREGSDYTAAIFASCLHAESVTIWKDVPGVLNADPKFFTDTMKFETLSYAEAIEMTYYGATVIHPKTIKPLRNARIPLFVKPFLSPEEPGTVIRDTDHPAIDIPIIIFKNNQALLSIFTKDYSFITEDHLSEIFGLFAEQHIKVNMMQNSALSFTVCIDFETGAFERLLPCLARQFEVKYNQDLQLITVKHYEQFLLDNLTKDKVVLLEQLSRITAQLVISEVN